MTSMFASLQPYEYNSARAMKINQAIAEYCVIDMRPISTIEGTGFQNLLHVLDSRYKSISRSTLLENYLVPMYQMAQDQVKQDLQSGLRHAFTTDAWTSMATEGYITTTVHFIDTKSITLQSRVLDTNRMLESHTAVNLAEEMKRTIEKWGPIDPCAVSDNAKNIMSACDLCEYPHFGCGAHTLNLIVSKGLAVGEMKSLVGKCKKVVAFFKTSDQRTINLMKTEKLMDLKVFIFINNYFG